jgi:hypothetical protein
VKTADGARFPPLANSDFWGLVNLTSTEAKVEFKSVQPWDPRINTLGS